MKIAPNAPAFPSQHDTDYRGLPIRAELAARAMQGILANPTLLNLNNSLAAHPDVLTRDAIRCADSLIAALNESEGN